VTCLALVDEETWNDMAVSDWKLSRWPNDALQNRQRLCEK